MSAPVLKTESASRLGFFTGVFTCVFLLAAVVIGAQASGLVAASGIAATTIVFGVAALALLLAIILDVRIGLRGGEGARTAAISALLLLLPTSAVAFIYLSGAPLA
ncbi:MAG: hypothetical protein ABWY54_04865 [Glaciihabitans sp.]